MHEVPGEAFGSHIEGEFTAELARIHGECTRIDSDAAAKGMFRSGRRLLLVSDAYVQGVQRHRRTVFDLWASYIKPHLNAGNAAECSAVLLSAFDKSLQAATVDHNARLTKDSSALQQNPLPILQAFLDKTNLERRALETQAQLHSALPVPSPLPQQVVVNATGRNNNISVGSGSAHQAVQTGTDLGSLALALAQLLAELHAQHADADLIAVVADAKTEAEASKPNKLKLASLLNGAATGVQVLGSAPTAWELVKAAGKAVGLL